MWSSLNKPGGAHFQCNCYTYVLSAKLSTERCEWLPSLYLKQ